jgi:hypothetical protein
MRTLSVPWRVSKHERHRFRGWPSWLRLACMISPVALAAALALALASCQARARDTAAARGGPLVDAVAAANQRMHQRFTAAQRRELAVVHGDLGSQDARADRFGTMLGTCAQRHAVLRDR